MGSTLQQDAPPAASAAPPVARPDPQEALVETLFESDEEEGHEDVDGVDAPQVQVEALRPVEEGGEGTELKALRSE